MTKPELEAKMAGLMKQIAERENQLRNSDPLWMNLQGQAAMAEKWLKSLGDDDKKTEAVEPETAEA